MPTQEMGIIRILTDRGTKHLLLKYQKFLSLIGFSVQQLFQLIQLNLPGSASLEDLLNPRRRKRDNSCNLRLLSLAAQPDRNVIEYLMENFDNKFCRSILYLISEKLIKTVFGGWTV